ncbi:MAG: hypothetical protein JSU87_14520 [Gemmatimonadota bacterium]|nr:MAG: hypothetical protein JSU87_14520 [Gemmatimonadota bacterium]
MAKLGRRARHEFKSKKYRRRKAPSDLSDLVERLDLWMEDLANWGRRVREDICKLEQAVHRLEKKANLKPTKFGDHKRVYGDPGDPPDPPWKPGG